MADTTKDEDTGTTPLVGKLAQIGASLQRFAKDEQVKGGGPSYGFTSINAIADVLRPAMTDWGILMMPERIDVLTNDKLERDDGRVSWRVVLRITWRVTDGVEELLVTSIGEAMDTSDKAANKAQTAARKYALIGLFNISTGDADPDHERPTATTASPKAIGYLKKLLEKYAEGFTETADARVALLEKVAANAGLNAHAEDIDKAVGDWSFDHLERAVVSDLIDMLTPSSVTQPIVGV